MLSRIGMLLLAIEGVLAAAHLRWPDYQWGQGRSSFLNLGNSLSLASWLGAMQLLAVGGLALLAFHRERECRDEDAGGVWGWVALAVVALWLSFAEFSRIGDRLGLIGLPDTDVYGRMVIGAGSVIGLGLLGWLLLDRNRERYRLITLAALFTWAGHVALSSTGWEGALSERLLWLAGGTGLLVAVGEYATGPLATARNIVETGRERPGPARPAATTMIGIAGTTFVLVFLQVVLFQVLTIFGDYVLANSVISIALLGICVGGLIGFLCAGRTPIPIAAAAAVLLPAGVILAFGTSVVLMDRPFIASVLLAVPFVMGSTVVTAMLVESETHLVYGLDLFGAGLGAIAVCFALEPFREEGTLLLLAALAALVALCFIRRLSPGHTRLALAAGCVAIAGGLTTLALLNRTNDFLNIIRTEYRRDHPEAVMIASRSSFAGRFDVARRTPTSTTLKTIENGRTIDTIRALGVEEHQIDPRLPHTLIDDPVILILGVSGDAITKTARAIGSAVYGAEINPVVVELMTGPLVPYNLDSYKDIDVEVLDGRTYVERGERRFDLITLMNAHFSRGGLAGRTACPEYLHTAEAFHTYFERLTDRGAIVIEEPLSRPGREPPIWKMLRTMREVLLERGVTEPERHFFIFQWRTRNNNYVQIVLTKTPLDDDRLARLRRWLGDVDGIDEISRAAGRRMGPILTARTTLLHTPDRPLTTTYARIVRGEMSDRFRIARNLEVITDDRPFPFDVDPRRPGLAAATLRVGLLMLGLVPLLVVFLSRHRRNLEVAVPFLLVVTLTGLAYFLIEMVLVQQLEIHLGSPVVTFATVLGTLLVGSGAGSLLSRQLGQKSLPLALAGVCVLLVAHLLVAPTLLGWTADLAGPMRIGLAVLLIAPLSLLLGVPLPTIMRLGKDHFTPSAAAMLFAVNAAASAVAIPVALRLSSLHGLRSTFVVGAGLYGLTLLLVVALDRRRLRVVSTALAAMTIVILVALPAQLSMLFGLGPDDAAEDEAVPPRVYAVRYGESSFSRHRLIRGGDRSREPFAWMVWLVRTEDRTILIDTGVDDPALAAARGIRRYDRPMEQLAALGLEPADVTDIVLTHAHWDHMGGLAPFETARIWIQEQEYAHVTTRLAGGVAEAGGMRVVDLDQLLRAEAEGRLERLSGSCEMVPGVTLVPGGAHTPGSQYVEVETLDGVVVLSGDATYLYENAMRHRPIGTTIDHRANLDAIHRMQERAASPFFLIPGHDPRVLRWFPEVEEGIVEITAATRAVWNSPGRNPP